ncbi:MAG: hypothetical protein JXR25_00295, partial [Pontiellaceae bacterium]|nr:hypothetical protein [Pontiellaceae bacterium]MBN2783238.1 hypothetical protein [Pontiellaceae bacterium]
MVLVPGGAGTDRVVIKERDDASSISFGMVASGIDAVSNAVSASYALVKTDGIRIRSKPTFELRPNSFCCVDKASAVRTPNCRKAN